jgi:hypothetical protein
MAGRERDMDDNASTAAANGSPDPETLYTKEFCIGSSHTFMAKGQGQYTGPMRDTWVNFSICT